jgi:hypothetical protein
MAAWQQTLAIGDPQVAKPLPTAHQVCIKAVPTPSKRRLPEPMNAR